MKLIDISKKPFYSKEFLLDLAKQSDGKANKFRMLSIAIKQHINDPEIQNAFKWLKRNK